jgi:hypothetical protein
MLGDVESNIAALGIGPKHFLLLKILWHIKVLKTVQNQYL